MSKYQCLTHDEKSEKKKIIIVSLSVGGLMIILVGVLGFPGDLWEPLGWVEFIRGLFVIVLLGAITAILMYGSELRLDYAIRRKIETGETLTVYYQGKRPDPKPVTTVNDYQNNASFLAGVGGISVIVLLIRYIYLIILAIFT